jgi:hypothetical protein
VPDVMQRADGDVGRLVDALLAEGLCVLDGGQLRLP